MTELGSAQTFPINLAGYTTIAQDWWNFRCYSAAESSIDASIETSSLQDPKTITSDIALPEKTLEHTNIPKFAHENPLSEATNWQWPKRPIIFISDPHADAQAFITSLVVSGGVTQGKKQQLQLTNMGKTAIFVIGGDCLDKGPSNLEMLRALKALMDTGAKVKLIAGNHDLRLLTGLSAINQQRTVGSEHMFVRMGSKVMPLFKEVFDTYLAHKNWQKSLPDEQTCKEALFPRESWFEEFPAYAQEKLSPKAIQKEVERLRKKALKFEEYCLDQGMTLPMVFAAAQKCHQLFFRKSGEFGWFFRKMQLAYKKGSFLFVHAGLDDNVSKKIQAHGIKHLNRRFKKTLRRDLFEFYFSSLATPFRTKYRESDPVFSCIGANAVQQRGIQCVVHGHVSHANGQQISLHKG